MKYLLLIHQGDTPTPRDPEAWAKLPEEEQQRVFADYQAINQTPGVTPGLQLGDPDTATTVRVEDGQTLTTDGPFVASRRRSAAGSCTRPTTSTPPSSSPSRIPAARLGGAIEVRPIVDGYGG